MTINEIKEAIQTLTDDKSRSCEERHEYLLEIREFISERMWDVEAESQSEFSK